MNKKLITLSIIHLEFEVFIKCWNLCLLNFDVYVGSMYAGMRSVVISFFLCILLSNTVLQKSLPFNTFRTVICLTRSVAGCEFSCRARCLGGDLKCRPRGWGWGCGHGCSD